MDASVSHDARCAGCSRPLERGAYLVVELETGRSFHSVACRDANGAAMARRALVRVLHARLPVNRDA